MKAILVLDKMPKSCAECDMLDSTVYYGYTWVHKCRMSWKEHTGKGRPSWCPLKEIPEKKDQLKYLRVANGDGTLFIDGQTVVLDERRMLVLINRGFITIDTVNKLGVKLEEIENESNPGSR